MDGGIIPARAGFTPPAPPVGRGRRGSSPLARGLPACRPSRREPLRIIPARAGFTGRRPTLLWALPDHPRSRGVYFQVSDMRGIMPGSSPLARGLPARWHHHRGGEDHPRSRGVYPRGGTTIGGRGSSPLARGLRVGRDRQRRRRRIIPARAGFTGSRRPRPCCLPDHPRSRGVYAGLGEAGAEELGSSPLARGLLSRGLGTDHAAGIIPARAGFTSCSFLSLDSRGDHPRSRGVYWMNGLIFSVSTGSSPLARGLLEFTDSADKHDGIIPARAGFTGGCRIVGHGASDHPRSRGVYPCFSM
ncbi:Domain of uncharacterised function (DUF2825) [Actinomyces viscosus]|uniref:Domain of uncharacterized function (DUF2825) n=1 Tax=Actinomyces viscosus TaxID=1656 RepID=A0A448PK18_ACTVI|nr:Domain of uncharacterised function (DUF2825) [Actinomyces viscosus]